MIYFSQIFNRKNDFFEVFMEKTKTTLDGKKIIIVRSNLKDRDPWLVKNIDTLIRGGFIVTLLCWNRESNSNLTKSKKNNEKYEEIRININAPYGIAILFFLPIWWVLGFFKLLATTWDIVHAINLDSIFPAIIASKIKKKPIVYEIYDVYADLIILPKSLRKIGIFIEKKFMQISDAIIIANESQEKELNGISNNNLTVIYNTPPDFFKIKTIKRKDTFTIFYAGVLYNNRPLNIDKVLEAITDIDKVQLVIAGYGNGVNDIKQMVKKSKNKAKYIGKISYSEVLDKTIKSDLLFALYDPIVPAVRHASCNKLFEAMMAHKPIIVGDGTAMADMVEKENCGIVVNTNNVDEIKKAILTLKNNPKQYTKLGANGRHAYVTKYNREIMENRLLDLYKNIF